MPFEDPKLCEEFTMMRLDMKQMHIDLMEHIKEEDGLKSSIAELLEAWNRATGILWFIKWLSIIAVGSVAFVQSLKAIGWWR